MAAEWAARRRARDLRGDRRPWPEARERGGGGGRRSALRKLGVPHATLVWTGPKPSTRAQERAREARYGLLAAHAGEIGADGDRDRPPSDDQAETVLFRLLRGSGVAGLAGMAAHDALGGLTLARPLLGLAKADLVAFCRARGASFVEDPSNVDPAYARTRLRALIGELAREGLDAEGFARLARRAAQADEALARMTAAAEARLGDGPIDARALISEPIAVVQRLLARRIAAVGGRDESRIGLEKIEALAARLRDAAAEGRALSANVGGALVAADGEGKARLQEGAGEAARQGTRLRQDRKGKGCRIQVIAVSGHLAAAAALASASAAMASGSSAARSKAERMTSTGAICVSAQKEVRVAEKPPRSESLLTGAPPPHTEK